MPRRSIRTTLSLLSLSSLIALPFATAQDLNSGSNSTSNNGEVVLLEDDFSRSEAIEDREQPGNGWGTNSKSRAKGNKQVDLDDGALRIYKHAEADHGVSLHQDIEFRNARISMRFKLGKKDDLGINIADMKEKSVHAGHLCMARIQNHMVEIRDLKTGVMNLQIRDARKAKKLTEDQNDLIKSKAKRIKHKIKPDQWHDLMVKIQGDVMSVSIDGDAVGEFHSEGIAHPTKRRLRIAVNKEAWIDDVKVVRLD